MRPATLVTIPFSHFCEKARWALDLTGTPYVEEGHAPGFHVFPVKRAGGKSTVPVLVTEEAGAIGDSTRILAYLDARAAEGKKLYPTDPAQRAEVLALEERFDDELGPHIRRLLYFHILPRKDGALRLMERGAPKWQTTVLRGAYPLLRALMKKRMRIDAAGAARSREATLRVFDDVGKMLADGRRFLVGDRLTAADVTFAALAAPGVVPAGSYADRLPPINALPPEVREIIETLRATKAGELVTRLYRNHRAPATFSDGPS